MKKKILIYSGASYTFQEYLENLIIKLLNNYEVYLIQNTYYLNQSLNLKSKLSYIKKTNKNFNYEFLNVYGQKQIIGKHFFYKKYLKKIFLKKFSLLITMTDDYLFDRYLIYFAKIFNVKTLLLHCNTLDRELLKKHKNLFSNFSKNESLEKIKNQNDIKFSIKVFKKIVSICSKIKKKIFLLVEFYIIPNFLIGTVFKISKYDGKIIPSGRTNYIFLFDKLETYLVKKLLKKNKIFFTSHPLQLEKAVNNNYNNLLLILSNYASEMAVEDFTRWIKNVTNLYSKYNINKIYIKFHPRTKVNLLWPKKLIKTLKKKNIRTKGVNNKKYLLKYLAQNRIIIGPMSGLMRSLSYKINNNSKIYCLMNSSGIYDDYKFFLGQNNKIIYLNNIDNFKYLKNIKNTKKYNLIKKIHEIL